MLDLKQALDLIQEHQRQIPVETVPIANALGIRVYNVPNWPNDLSGMVRKNTDAPGGFDIFVNGGHSETRRRFTIAHEIAHAVLHPQLIGDGITDDALLRSGLSSAVEVQANRLAADILMPRQAIHEFIDRGITEVDELGRIDIHRSQIMAAARCTNPAKCIVRRS